MNQARATRRDWLAFVIGTLGVSGRVLPAMAMTNGRSRGFNLIETSNAPFGSDLAAQSLRRIAGLGADRVALIPFLWQSGPHDAGVMFGDALPLDRLERGIAQARAAGLRVTVKPHVWVPGGWAGQVRMRTAQDWQRWFSNYRAALLPIAACAASGGADWFVIGTELRQTIDRGEWRDVIHALREAFPGHLTYVAHGADEAERVQFWEALDAVAASLYPVLGAPADKGAWHRAIRRELARLTQTADRAGKPLSIGEIGIRSAQGATLRPWESAEEREAASDSRLQAEVIAAWLFELARMDVAGLLIWRWFTDPDRGGLVDTDFTVQGKAAEQLIAREWGADAAARKEPP